MGQKELREQPQLIEAAIKSVDASTLGSALEGTLGDAQSFCWATLRQFERRAGYTHLSTPRDYGLQHAEYHMLLGVAHDTVSHVATIERLLDAMGQPSTLAPDGRIREELREARNLLATHRDQRVLYRRLTGKHTPHVVESYKRLGLTLPSGSIDKEIIAYAPPPGATEQEIAEGYASVGTVGDMLSLRDLYFGFKQLETDLDDLANQYRPAT